MTRYAVQIADEAWAGIEAQISYIAVEKKAPENAARWSVRLLDAIESLQVMPDRSTVDEFQTRTAGITVYRLTSERTYLVFYTIDPLRQRVTVLSFRHGARNRS